MQAGIFSELQNGKTVPVTQEMVWRAYKSLRNKGKQHGLDVESQRTYEDRLKDNLYILWNRLSSGSYFPPPVREVVIPKVRGRGDRKLGIAPLSDKVGQMVVKQLLEPRLEAIFHDSSYGYRPGRGAHNALREVRKNCFSHGWVLDLDIEGFFDNIDHNLLMEAVAQHVEEKWILMYIRRWLSAPMELPDGTLKHRECKGTPQGGVLSPLLANLFLHYVLDKWLSIHYEGLKFERYADDVIIHCDSEEEAQNLLGAIKSRLGVCKLRLNEEKTQIVYCKSYKMKESYPRRQFEFLGYSFQPRELFFAKNKREIGFTPAISRQSASKITKAIRETRILKQTETSLGLIAQTLNVKLRGWINYYGQYRRFELKRVFAHLDKRLMKWLRKKYKRLKGSEKKARLSLQSIRRNYPELFEHWRLGLSIVGR